MTGPAVIHVYKTVDVKPIRYGCTPSARRKELVTGERTEMFAQEHREAWRCSLSRVLLFAISVSSKTQSVALFWFPFPLGPLLLPQSLYIYINVYYIQIYIHKE